MDEYTVQNITDVFSYDRIPFRYNKNDKMLMIRGMDFWISTRGIPQTREDYNDILFENKVKSGRQLSIGSFALNLTDHYWIHGIDNPLHWEEMNFFDNEYRQGIELEPIRIREPGDFLDPNLSVDGNLIKAWLTEKQNI